MKRKTLPLVILVFVLNGCTMPSESYRAQENEALLGGVNDILNSFQAQSGMSEKTFSIYASVFGALVLIMIIALGVFVWLLFQDRMASRKAQAKAQNIALSQMAQVAQTAMKSTTPTVSNNTYHVTINAADTTGLLLGANRPQLEAPEIYTIADLNAVLENAQRQVAQLEAPKEHKHGN